jgi:hypothetical protein
MENINLKITGQFHAEVIDTTNNTIVSEINQKNLVVKSGLDLISHLLVDDATKIISKFKAGDSNSISVKLMTDLQGAGKTGLLDIVSYEYPSSSRVKVNFELAKTEGNGITIREFGLFTEDDVMFNRVVWDTEFAKTSTYKITGYFLITINP